MKKIVISFCFLLTANFLSAQMVADFRVPMDIPLILSGNFGELRSDHFHSGIDIKTQGVTGHKVFAIESGYVSRIKVQPGGYGKALYIAHPNGYTSVYGHLENYNKKINDYVSAEQYRRESHMVDLYLKEGALTVKKGAVIGYSGNTGSSSGPHLHFEVRRSSDQHPLNVLLFDFPVVDQIAPRFTKLVIYPEGEDAQVEYNSEPLVLDPVSMSDTYHLADDRIPLVHGNIGFGIEIFDYLDGAPNRCGVLSLGLTVDGKQVFYSEMNEFSFSESRFINAHIDYGRKIINNDRVQRLFKLPYNELSIYKFLDNNGLAEITDTMIHEVSITATDTYGNKSQLDFRVRGTGTPRRIHTPEKTPVKILPYGVASSFTKEGISLHFPAYCFYEDIPFSFAQTGGNGDLLSDIYYIHEVSTPVHRRFTIEIVPDKVPGEAFDKLCLVSLGADNDFSYAGGSFQDGKVTGEIREFGKYAIAIDTVPPILSPLNIHPEKDLSGEPGMRFMVEDDLSGISAYNGYIDDQWVLFQYDPKNNLLFYEFDERVPKSRKNHELEIHLTDDRGNKTVYQTAFFR